MLTQICKGLDENWKSKLGTRASTEQMTAFITGYAHKAPILILDDLHKLSAANMGVILKLLGSFTIIASSRDSEKHKELWWKFKRLELKPLTEEAAKEMIHYLTQNMSITDYEMMETKLLGLSNFYPMPIVDMVAQLRYEPVVKTSSVRDIHHDGGVRYRDWTPAFMVLWGLLIMSRFIALGTHSFEGYILAGCGLSVFMAGRMIFRGKR